MPKIAVEIEWKKPDHPYWMNPDNVALCLHAYCKNTKFEVRWARGGDPWKTRRRERRKKPTAKVTKFREEASEALIGKKGLAD